MGYLWRFIKKGLIISSIICILWMLMLIISCIGYYSSPDNQKGIWGPLWDFFKFYEGYKVKIDGVSYSYKDLQIGLFLSLIISAIILPLIFNLIYVLFKYKKIVKLCKEKLEDKYEPYDCRFFLVSEAYNMNMGKLYGEALDIQVVNDICSWKGVIKKDEKGK